MVTGGPSATDWRAFQLKLARWYVNTVPAVKITPPKLAITGVDGDVWEAVLEEREHTLPDALCPWQTPSCPPYHTGDEYHGAHYDYRTQNKRNRPFLGTIIWPKQLTPLGYLPRHFGSVLRKIGVPKRKISPLLQKISRLCRKHARDRSRIHEGCPPVTATTTATDEHHHPVSENAQDEISQAQKAFETIFDG